MPDLYYTKQGPAMHPADDRAMEWHAKQKTGEWLLLKVSSPRNPKFHRKAMALLNYAYDNSDHDCPFDAWRRALTILAGYYDTVTLPSGKARVEAQSISFAAMDEETFEQWYSAMIDVILKHVLTTHTEQEIVDQIVRFG